MHSASNISPAEQDTSKIEEFKPLMAGQKEANEQGYAQQSIAAQAGRGERGQNDAPLVCCGHARSSRTPKTRTPKTWGVWLSKNQST